MKLRDFAIASVIYNASEILYIGIDGPFEMTLDRAIFKTMLWAGVLGICAYWESRK